MVRDPHSGIVLDEPRVSWQHAILRRGGGQRLLEDAGSKNGPFVGSQRAQRVEITGACEVRLGDPDFGPVLSCSAAPRRMALSFADTGDISLHASNLTVRLPGGKVILDDVSFPLGERRIGLVPRENILHTQLSARRALRYAAELRFPRDTSPAEREQRIGEVLKSSR